MLSIDKPLVLEKFNIRDEIQRNLFILEPIILRNHNKFTVQCPNAMLCMYSDPKRVIKILINIISKLSSITHENIITLRVKPKKLGDMDAIEFKINSMGAGFDSDQLNQIMTIFAQSEVEVINAGEQNLSYGIAKKNTDELFGKISIMSGIVEGATFKILLPMDHKEAEDKASKIFMQPLFEAV